MLERKNHKGQMDIYKTSLPIMVEVYNGAFLVKGDDNKL